MHELAAESFHHLLKHLSQITQAHEALVDQRPYQTIYRENKLTLRLYTP